MFFVIGQTFRFALCKVPAPRCVTIFSRQRPMLSYSTPHILFFNLVMEVTDVRVSVFSAAPYLRELSRKDAGELWHFP